LECGSVSFRKSLKLRFGVRKRQLPQIAEAALQHSKRLGEYTMRARALTRATRD